MNSGAPSEAGTGDAGGAAEAAGAARARFRTHGLTFDSDLPAPGAEAWRPGPGEAADVEVRLGPAPRPPAAAPIAGLWRAPAPDRLFLETPQARFLIEGGRRVQVEPAPGVGADRLGFALGAWASCGLLHQRARMPLHAAAVAGPEGAALLIGASGAGKSTMTRLLARDGFSPGGDDMIALDIPGTDAGPDAGPDAGAVRAHRAPRTAKLFADSDAAFADLALAGRAGAAVGGYGKDVLLLPEAESGAGAVAWPAPLRAIFALEWLHPAGAPCELARIAPGPAMALLRESINHPQLIGPLGLERRYFALLARLVSRVPVFALRRPRRFESSAEAAGLIRGALAAAVRNGASPT